jgi:2-haloalkanoic acid dehalogenase type II
LGCAEVAVGKLYDVITFDCYGTLVDWESGIAAAFSAAGVRAGVAVDAAAALRAYAEIEPVVQAERYRKYREVLGETARRVCARLGWPLSDADSGFLAESMSGWRPFPDTNGALTRLAADHSLGILSNVDDDLLAETRRQLAVGFDPVITAEQVQSYKPAHAHFTAARERIGERRWLHAAQSHFHDVAPARSLGIATAWINRKTERAPQGGTPDIEALDLEAFADWVCG